MKKDLKPGQMFYSYGFTRSGRDIIGIIKDVHNTGGDTGYYTIEKAATIIYGSSKFEEPPDFTLYKKDVSIVPEHIKYSIFERIFR